MFLPKKHFCFSGTFRVVSCIAIISLIVASCQEDEEIRMPTFLIACSDTDVSLQADKQNVQVVCVKVLDADSVPMSGVKTYFSLVQGTATFADSISTSDADGVASVQMTPGTQTGDVVVKVQAEKLLKLPLHFYFRLTAAAPAKIEVQSGNFQEARQGIRLPNLVFLKVTDEFGNPVYDAPVSFKIKSGNGALSASSAVTFNGLATLEFTTGTGAPVTTITASVSDNISTDITVYTLLPIELSAVNEDKKIQLAWTKTVSPNFKRYILYGGTSFSETQIMETDDVNVTTFTHLNTNMGTLHSYYVKVETTLGDHVSSERKTVETGFFVKLPYIEDGDICLDRQNSLIYICPVYESKILVLSAEPFKKQDSIMLIQAPHRIALNKDATKLYVTYPGRNVFDIFDLATKSIERTVDVSSVMADGFVTDIYVATNGQLFISGRRIVKVNESDNYSLQVIASSLSFYTERARFLADDGTHLYVEVSNQTPNSLFKIDISQTDGPLILEDEHGTVSGTTNAVLSKDATRLYTNNGKIVLTSDFTTAGELPDLTYAVAVSGDGADLYTSSRFNYAKVIKVLNATSFVTEKQWEVGFLASQIFSHENSLYIFAEIEIPSDVWRLYKVNLNE
jgi:hypothetical protein